MAIVIRKNRDGSKTYQVKLRDAAGQWFPTTGFKTVEDAQAEELRLKALKRKGSFAISNDAKSVSMQEYWEVWSIENRSHVSAGWKISQDQMYRSYVQPVLGELKMIQIKAPDIGKVLSRAQQKGIGDQTRKHIYSLLRKMFNDAVEYYEMLAANPVKPKFHRPKVSLKTRKFLMPTQAWRLLEVSKNHYLGPAIWLQILAGLRPSEVQALRGSSLLFELDHILICAAYNNKTKALQDHPKQEDWGYSPMPPQLKSYLLSLRIGPNDFVAKSEKGQMLSYHTYLGALKNMCKTANVPSVTPHELRHTATEIYFQAGATVEDVRRLLNHSSLSATKSYIHRTDERLNAVAGNIQLSSGNTIKNLQLTSDSMFPNMFPNGNKEASSSSDEEEHHVH